MRKALITGLSGTVLTDAERCFLAELRPAGVILFARNLDTHEQIRRLTDAAREAVAGDDLLILIDQEGGRVQRLRPPLGRLLPPARAFSTIPTDQGAQAARLVFRLLAEDLRDLGINCDCTPVLDVPVAGADGIIGDRAYGEDPAIVAALGVAVADGLMAGGVVPVVKHIPGHGRATCDSHLALPTVKTPREELDRTDFRPFKELAHLPAAMTAHVVFSAVDPDAPATLSTACIEGAIRRDIGFDGLLMTDDLSMRALTGPMRLRAETAIAAGCDVTLHCNGNMTEMLQAAEGTPWLAGAALRRFEGAMRVTAAASNYDREDALRVLAGLLEERAV